MIHRVTEMVLYDNSIFLYVTDCDRLEACPTITNR